MESGVCSANLARRQSSQAIKATRGKRRSRCATLFTSTATPPSADGARRTARPLAAGARPSASVEPPNFSNCPHVAPVRIGLVVLLEPERGDRLARLEVAHVAVDDRNRVHPARRVLGRRVCRPVGVLEGLLGLPLVPFVVRHAHQEVRSGGEGGPEVDVRWLCRIDWERLLPADAPGSSLASRRTPPALGRLTPAPARGPGRALPPDSGFFLPRPQLSVVVGGSSIEEEVRTSDRCGLWEGWAGSGMGGAVGGGEGFFYRRGGRDQ